MLGEGEAASGLTLVTGLVSCVLCLVSSLLSVPQYTAHGSPVLNEIWAQSKYNVLPTLGYGQPWYMGHFPQDGNFGHFM